MTPLLGTVLGSAAFVLLVLVAAGFIAVPLVQGARRKRRERETER